MLLIYDYLVDHISKHLALCKIQAAVESQIGKEWHCSRYIQVMPAGWSSAIHYEYCNGYWELHFEDTSEDAGVDSIRKETIVEFENNDKFGWHRWSGRQRGLLRLESEVEDADAFKALFNEIYNATYDVVNRIVTGKSELCDGLEKLEYSDKFEEPLENSGVETTYAKPKYPEIQSVAELPFDRFTIPSYQRPYKWTRKNVKQLIDDILCFKESSEYRLGTLVLHSVNGTGNKSLYIVDGQQRMITISLLLYQLMNEESYSQLFNEELRKSITHFLGKKQFNDSLTKKNILENLKVIRHRLVDFAKDSVEFLLNRCRLVVITLYDISEAFQFFDSQNARGKELAPHDLLKAFHLRAIDNMEEKDQRNIIIWENYPTSRLELLFLMLYRIKRWIGAKEARYFTSQDVGIFKGLNASDNLLPYQKIYTIAQCYTALYNQDIARRLDRNKLDYPHQIDQVTINGSLFFDMVRYYHDKVNELNTIMPNVNPEVMDAVNSLNRGRGDKYIRLLFDAACLFYYDKFGEDNLKRAMDSIFAWVYGKRLRAYSIKLASIDNLARGNEGESFFSMLHNSIRPSDILSWSVPVVKEEDISKNQSDNQKVINLMKQLRYVE